MIFFKFFLNFFFFSFFFFPISKKNPLQKKSIKFKLKIIKINFKILN